MESTFAQNIWGKKVRWSSIRVKGSQNYSDVAQKKMQREKKYKR